MHAIHQGSCLLVRVPRLVDNCCVATEACRSWQTSVRSEYNTVGRVDLVITEMLRWRTKLNRRLNWCNSYIVGYRSIYQYSLVRVTTNCKGNTLLWFFPKNIEIWATYAHLFEGVMLRAKLPVHVPWYQLLAFFNNFMCTLKHNNLMIFPIIKVE